MALLPVMTEVGCWMHARRYFLKALESDEPHMGPALHLIARLYAGARQGAIAIGGAKVGIARANAGLTARTGRSPSQRPAHNLSRLSAGSPSSTRTILLNEVEI